ncbi:hypothetical protein SteCoe_12745 [Stentor coeruleus]|uniref:Uncharacterized protein n=1 Tax=Stentor coeruleus TaxID=5963 RepID=A0A1R2CA04_9CILI|nr:hypothetical protein SteCoe_12745 [Stentor coeruleus]
MAFIMCLFNMLCPISDGSCNCTYMKELPSMQFYQPGMSSSNEPQLNIFQLLVYQSQMIKNSLEMTKLVLEKISEKLSENVPKGINSAIPPTDDPISAISIRKYLYPSISSFPYKLILSSPLPSPAYKERAFSLYATIVSSDNNSPVHLPCDMNFKLLVFSAESPVEPLITNTSGDKIMRGTLDAEGDSAVVFKKIIIKEVTSHFRNGVFFLVVLAQDTDKIQPLIIDDLVIKARKISVKDPKKKIKLDDNVQVFDTINKKVKNNK